MNAIIECIEQNCMFDQCRTCLKQHGTFCALCANDIFDERFMISLNGNNYLTCNQNSIAELNICQFYCQGNGKVNSHCNPMMNTIVCVCYDEIVDVTSGNFTGSLSLSSALTASGRSVAARVGYSEFAVGLSNGVVNVFNSFGGFIRSFLGKFYSFILQN
jgi:hypothetical protein